MWRVAIRGFLEIRYWKAADNLSWCKIMTDYLGKLELPISMQNDAFHNTAESGVRLIDIVKERSDSTRLHDAFMVTSTTKLVAQTSKHARGQSYLAEKTLSCSDQSVGRTSAPWRDSEFSPRSKVQESNSKKAKKNLDTCLLHTGAQLTTNRQRSSA
jgi:hypothetical protein